MATILPTKSIYYNDVNLIARPSAINSRSEIPKELNRIIVSPMAAVVGKTFAIEANRLGLTVCLHRFCSVEEQIDICKALPDLDNAFVSVGANDPDRVNKLSKAGITNFVIDIANGYIPSLKSSVARLNANVRKLMVGNVMTSTGFWNASNTHIDTYIRVGIAGGSACSTSDATGYNRGQITEIMEIKKLKDEIGSTGYNNFIVADGGIKNGNYAAKAFAAGCFLPGQKVNISNGIKNIEQINVGDKVKTHKLRFQGVTNTFKYQYNGKIYIINGIKCTPSHEFYVINKKYKNLINDNNIHEYAAWIRADKLTSEFLLLKH